MTERVNKKRWSRLLAAGVAASLLLLSGSGFVSAADSAVTARESDATEATAEMKNEEAATGKSGGEKVKESEENKTAAGESGGKNDAEGEKNPAKPISVVGVYGEMEDAAYKRRVTVKGVRPEDTGKVSVRAYQLVDGYYVDGKLVRYVAVDPDHAGIASLEQPTAAEVSRAAAAVANGAYTNLEHGCVQLQADQETGAFYADVEPGLYLVLVSGSQQTVYNPAIVSVNVTDANTGKGSGGEADLSSFFKDAGGVAYLKYTSYGRELTADKKIAGSAHTEESLAAADSPVEVAAPYGDAVAKGDEITFHLDEITLPAYTDAWKAPRFLITDTLDESFSGWRDLKVEIRTRDESTKEYGEWKELSADGAYTMEGGVGSKQFTITVLPAFLISFQNETELRPELRVIGTTTLSDDANYNFSENVNHMAILYSNDLHDPESTRRIDRSTYHYTFAIDGLIDPQSRSDVDSKSESWQTSELVKFASAVSEGEKTPELAVRTSELKEESEETVRTVASGALSGAEFTLYADEEMRRELIRVTSDGNGTIPLAGLDTGTYYLKETAAPKHYSLNPMRFRVRIGEIQMNEQGAMTSYRVEIACKTETEADYRKVRTFTYEAEPEADSLTGRIRNTVKTTVETHEPVLIRNVALQKLPSAGGGTGVPLLAAAGLAAFSGAAVSARRRKRRMSGR